MSLFINRLEEDAPCGIELAKVKKSACSVTRHLAKEGSQFDSSLSFNYPIHFDAEVFRLLPSSFDVLATLTEGLTPQQSAFM